MVCLPLLQRMHEFYKEHLDEYIEKHPGEWVIIQSGREGLEAKFYENKREFDEEILKYKGKIRYTILTKKIPNPPFDECNKDQIWKFITTIAKKQYVKPTITREDSLVDITF